jgi:hypothetical protein
MRTLPSAIAERTSFEIMEPRVFLDANAAKGTWIEAVTQTAACIMMEADGANCTTAATVHYGTTSAYGSTATTTSQETPASTTNVKIHNIQLTGLAPNTLYHYSVQQGATGWTADQTFYTAAPIGVGYTFAWQADTRPDYSNPSTIPVHGQMAQQIDAYNPRFTIYGGDATTDANNYTEWGSEWFVAGQDQLGQHTPVYWATGNHEGWNATTQAFTQDTSASGNQGYYSFDYGDVHVTILNNYIDYSTGSAQWNWAMADANSADTQAHPFRIAAWHEPAWGWGAHGPNPQMQQFCAQIFEPAGYCLALSGHNHFYQHVNLDPYATLHGTAVTNTMDLVTMGSAGAYLNTPNGPTPPVVAQYQDWSMGIFNVQGHTLSMTVYDNYGTILDTLTITKPNTAPTSTLSALPGGGMGGRGNPVTLTATAADTDGMVQGVDFYNGTTKIATGALSGGVWTASWVPSTVGSYNITAKATDDDGVVTTSTARSFTVRLPGDGNGDNVVDGLDYGVWQNGYQQPGASFAKGDYNGDGVVDGLDYGVWQNNYNAHVTSDTPITQSDQVLTADAGVLQAVSATASSPVAVTVDISAGVDALAGAAAVQIAPSADAADAGSPVQTMRAPAAWINQIDTASKAAAATDDPMLVADGGLNLLTMPALILPLA